MGRPNVYHFKSRRIQNLYISRCKERRINLSNFRCFLLFRLFFGCSNSGDIVGGAEESVHKAQDAADGQEVVAGEGEAAGGS